MKISIVTPTLNQADFIEETIKSVLQQNYNETEMIIIDGGSTDGTLDILKKYPEIKWLSEKDRGQSDAINKGLRMAGGDIVAYLNSDDYYDKNILTAVSDYFIRHEDCMVLYGNITYIAKEGTRLYTLTGDTITFESLVRNPDLVRQPSTFWRRRVLDEVGFFDENLHVVMDLDFLLRVSKKFRLHYLNMNISFFRYYTDNKTLSLRGLQTREMYSVLRRHFTFLPLRSYKFLFGRYLDSLDDKSMIKRFFTIFRKRPGLEKENTVC